MERIPAPPPGPQINLNDKFWRPTGSEAGAEMTFYLGARPHPEAGEERIGSLAAVTMLDESLELEALRYVRPCSAKFHQTYPGRHGVSCKPELHGSHEWVPPELLEQAAKTGRPIYHSIRSESAILEHCPEALSTCRYSIPAPGIALIHLPEGAA